MLIIQFYFQYAQILMNNIQLAVSLREYHLNISIQIKIQGRFGSVLTSNTTIKASSTTRFEVPTLVIELFMLHLHDLF